MNFTRKSNPQARLTTWLAAALLSCVAASGFAQIKTDSSLGHAAQTLSGPNYLIPQSLGLLSGSNLFQSFQTFNIGTGQSATFTTITPGIANVVSRVTGGSLSQINGTLSLVPVSGAPSFFFINPAGVIFGAGAAINVPGAFHVGTADYVKFPDGKFHADLNQTSTFSSAPPEAFGFLGTNRATVAIKPGATLVSALGQTVGIVAGDITIDGGGTYGGAGIYAPAGEVRLVANGQAAREIPFTGPLPAAYGSLSILGGGFVQSSSVGAMNGGNIAVSSGDIALDSGSFLLSLANVGTTGNAGSVSVSATGSLAVTNSASIVSATASSGNAGAVSVTAGSISIDGQAVQGNIFPTRISSEAFAGAGNAGSVTVSATGNLSIVNGGTISADTNTSGNAGSVNVTAGTIYIDGQVTQGAPYLSGISSNANPSSTGNAGSVDVTATGSLSILNGGLISSSTFASGNAGVVNVTAGSISIDGQALQGNTNLTGILSEAFSGTGNAGNVTVSAESSLTIINGGIISSDTYTPGNAGPVNVSAGSISIDGQGAQGNFTPTGISSSAAPSSAGNAGSIVVTTAGNLSIVNGGTIATDTASVGNAGPVRVTSGSISIDGQGVQGNYLQTGIFSQADPSSTGKAASVTVSTAGSLSISNGGSISTDTYSTGDAGGVNVSAGNILIDGQAVQGNWTPTGIFSDANPQSSGNAGNVTVLANAKLSISNGGSISSDTYSSGIAGPVSVSAGSMTIDGQEVQNLQSAQSAHLATGISSSANSGSSGTGGIVTVNVADDLMIANAGHIASFTFGSGNAETVNVNAGSILIDGQSAEGNYIATGIFSSATYNSTAHANAGTTNVTVRGNLTITNGGYISSDTQASGDAGKVNVSAGSISIDGQSLQNMQSSVQPGNLATGISSDAGLYSTGNAKNVSVTTAGNLSITNGGTISTNTSASGDAGFVNVSAGSISIDGYRAQGNSTRTGVFSLADIDSTGSAGTIAITATGNISVTNGGEINSSTYSPGSPAPTFNPGSAGSVQLTTGSLLVDGFGSLISASAYNGSSGQTGSVSVNATNSITLSNGGALSIQNFATVPTPALASLAPTLLSVSAPYITLQNSSITAASTGNVAASDINIRFSKLLYLDPSSISTSANLGNGGNIVIQGGDVIDLNNSQITTSVAGTAGNGGNISIGATALVMNTGFIQANTAAQNAIGGVIDINVQTLVPSGNTLFVGGSVPYIFQPGVFGFNVIQAAAPTGVSGAIDITSPVLDITGSLRGLGGQTIDTGGLGRSLCQTSGGSSLAQAGRGGLPPTARGLLRTEPALAAKQTGAAPPSSGSDVTIALSNWSCN